MEESILLEQLSITRGNDKIDTETTRKWWEFSENKWITGIIWTFIVLVILAIIILPLYFSIFIVTNVPTNDREPVSYSFHFTKSRRFTWDEFNDYIINQIGYSLSFQSSPMKNRRDIYTNLINTVKGDDLIFKLDAGVTIDIDLNKRGRFLLMNDANIKFEGSINSSFILENGRGVWDGDVTNYVNNWSNATGIRQNGGELEIISCSIHVNNGRSTGATGMYLSEGICNMRNIDESDPPELFFKDNVAEKSACAGLSIWNVHLTIFADNGLIRADNCVTSWHCGGFIIFKGILELIGENSCVHTYQCKAGKNFSNYTHAGGIQLGSFCYLEGIARVIFSGKNTSMIAEDCKAGSASGFYVDCAIIESYNDNPVLIAFNNEIIHYKSMNSKPCAILIKELSSIEGNTPLLISSHDNTCYKKDGCKQYINNSKFNVENI